MRAGTLAFLLVLPLLAGCLTDGDAPSTQTTDPTLDGGVRSAIADAYSVLPGNFSFDNPLGGSVPLEEGPFSITSVQKIVLQSAVDGVDIDLSVWLPDTCNDTDDCLATDDVPTRFPAIIQASPYFPATDSPSGSQNFGQWLHDVFVPHGYAYVQLAIRSTAESGGCDDFRGPLMTADMSQAIDWIAAQPWSDGGVALTGKSYPGSTPWYAAGSGNPAIKTIVPVSGSTNAWEVYARNGTPESRAAIIVPNYGATAATNTERSPEHKVENFACVEVWEAWVNGVSSGASGERVTAQWWDERNSKPGVEANYEGSILLVHGLEDWNVDPAVAIPWTQELADSGLFVHQLLGQWQHDHPDQSPLQETRRWDWAQVLLNWFDHELKGADVDVGPPVQVQSNDGRWRDELAWPPKDALPLRLHLSGDRTLSEEPGAHQAEPVAVASTPLTWRMDLEEATRIAGLPTIHVTVTPTGPSGYLGAILYDEAPDGSRTRLGWTGMNFRFHAGGHEPQTVVPGTDIVLRMQLQPLDVFVPAGHTLALDLGPLLTPEDRIPAPYVSPFLLHFGEGYGPEVTLPVIERDEAVFFQPPMPA